MNRTRRDFFKQSAIAMAGTVFIPPAALSGTVEKADALLQKLSRINDAGIEALLVNQIDKPGDRWHGGVVDDFEIPNAVSTTWFIVHVGSAYACEFSKYHFSARLVNALETASACLLNVQHDDGTVDFHETNWHSPPDTAFVVNFISPIFIVLRDLNRRELQLTVNALGEFISNTGKYLAVGGIHTANHRWVICSALARVHSFFPDQKYIDRIDEWLSEGVDLDPDGQYEERSVGTYSPVCDEMFLTLGRLLNRPELVDVVRKNLDMTLYYIQPGGELMTNASHRQDDAQTSYVSVYYYSYKYLSILDGNRVYAAVCELIENELPQEITGEMALLMEDPVFKKSTTPAARFPDNYSKRFVHSGVFRIRRGDTDVSIIEQNPTFLVFMKHAAVMHSMRLGTAFFGRRGQFVPEKVTVEGDAIVLTKSITHGYFQPFPEVQRTGDGDWSKLPRSQRASSGLQNLNYRVAITESSGEVSIDIRIEGTDNVPVSLELTFRTGGELEGVIADRDQDDIYFLEKGMGRYRKGNSVIEFGPGTASHKWAHIRGMFPKPEGSSVYLTGYSPFVHSVKLR